MSKSKSIPPPQIRGFTGPGAGKKNEKDKKSPLTKSKTLTPVRTMSALEEASESNALTN